MKLLVDVSLSPAWVEFIGRAGWKAVHWATIGDPRAKDRVILDWARKNGYLVFTHDLDFGTILAATRAAGPSVIQIRTQDVLPDRQGALLVAALRRYEKMLDTGALISLDEKGPRARILPLGP
jgi:predicted nuclease of predicted toxin-antitoxin system